MLFDAFRTRTGPGSSSGALAASTLSHPQLFPAVWLCHLVSHAGLSNSVLIEAGYRCAVPTCRNILAIDMHHIIEVKDGGPNEPSNLLALCPTCHALYTRGTIPKEAINAWKTMLVTLSHAFD